MADIKDLLKQNPHLLSIESEQGKKKERRRQYEEKIGSNFEELHEISKQYVKKVTDLPQWRFEYLATMFDYGVRMGKEYEISLKEVERLFNQVLFNYVKGGLLGAFISGLYSRTISKDDVLSLDLTHYYGVSGLGFRHSTGTLIVKGNGALYLGTEASGGEILARGNMSNCVGKRNNGCKITVEGNVRNWAGMEMRDGMIKVSRNAGDILGEKMSGGEIVVEGNAGHWVGDDMSGGTIKIKGDFTPSGERSRGEIYCWRNGWVKWRD